MVWKAPLNLFTNGYADRMSGSNRGVGLKKVLGNKVDVFAMLRCVDDFYAGGICFPAAHNAKFCDRCWWEIQVED